MYSPEQRDLGCGVVFDLFQLTNPGIPLLKRLDEMDVRYAPAESYGALRRRPK
jgi:hypothetical protein